MRWSKKDILDIIDKNNLQVGTSFYAYDLDICLEKIENVRKNFRDWNLIYSIKANPNITLLKKFVELGLGMDAASKEEVLLARSLGCPPDRIFYSSPGKALFDLKCCYNQCVLVADSSNEVNRILTLSEELCCPINIGIRINLPNPNIKGNAFEVMGGSRSKFGMTTQELELISRACKGSMVNIIGIHIYFGSQILNESVLISNFITIADYAIELCNKFKLNFVTFGGGFGVPYSESDKSLNLSHIAFEECLQDKISQLKSKNIKCNLELGRYLVAESGVFCASIEDIKVSYNKKYVILSAGMNAFIRPIFTKEFHKLNSCKPLGLPVEKVTIVGNLCTPIDQYYEDYEIESPEIGDWLWFENAGAYGYSMSMLHFISHDLPLELIKVF